jgi:hypothetical protein
MGRRRMWGGGIGRRSSGGESDLILYERKA